MGIYSSMARILIQNARRYARGGAAVTLGVHHFNYSEAELREMFRACGVTPDDACAAIPNTRIANDWMRPDALDAATLFRWLGFASVDELDVSAYEGASILHDLNAPLPPQLAGAYDLVFDGGTLEHVFHLGQGLFNCARLLRPGGTVIHVHPLSGWINHGFVQVCPTLLYDFYSTNGFSDLHAHVIEINRVAGVAVRHFALGDASTENLMFNDFRSKTVLLFFARKVDDRTLSVPIQGSYRRLFSGAGAPPPGARASGDRAPAYVARSEPRIAALSGQSRWVAALASLLPRRWFARLHAGLIEHRHRRSVRPRHFADI